MPKTKNETNLVPRTIQQLFTWTAVAAFLLNAFYWALLLGRVYSYRSFRMSQFSVIALGEIVLPLVLFGVAYTFVRASTSRTGHMFMACLLALTGILIERFFVLLDWTPLGAFVQSAHHLDPIWTSSAYILITLVIYGGLLFFISQQKNRFTAARTATLAFLWVAPVSYAVSTFTNLAMHKGSSDVFGLPITLMQFAELALPLAFAGIAYFGVPKIMHGRERAGLIIIVTTIGTLIFQAILSVDMIIRQLPRAHDFVWPDSLVLTGSLSLLVYVSIIAVYRTYDGRNT